ncbi:MAG: hypothetical protein QME66_01910 [Candidatus Eisenbacteria bacterium]|nr:hypothetical protein [Candidatus Eisenbacteria bacterium]
MNAEENEALSGWLSWLCVGVLFLSAAVYLALHKDIFRLFEQLVISLRR